MSSALRCGMSMDFWYGVDFSVNDAMDSKSYLFDDQAPCTIIEQNSMLVDPYQNDHATKADLNG